METAAIIESEKQCFQAVVVVSMDGIDLYVASEFKSYMTQILPVCLLKCLKTA